MNGDRRLALRTFITIAVRSGLQVAALFVPAASWNWPAAWVLVAITIVGSLISAAFLWGENKDLLRERMSSPVHAGQPLIDKVLLVAFMAIFICVLVVSSLDVWHWRGSPAAASGLALDAMSLAGLALVLAGPFVWIATLRANAFASQVVKLQAERDHHVIDTGPYGLVRHPMYTGILMTLVGQPLWLGSWTGFAVALCGVAVMAARAVIEERFLSQSLDGYEAYCAKVRYRIVPGIW